MCYQNRTTAKAIDRGLQNRASEIDRRQYADDQHGVFGQRRIQQRDTPSRVRRGEVWHLHGQAKADGSTVPKCLPLHSVIPIAYVSPKKAMDRTGDDKWLHICPI